MVRPGALAWITAALSALLVSGLIWLAVSPAPTANQVPTPAVSALAGDVVAEPNVPSSGSAEQTASTAPESALRNRERADSMRDALMALYGTQAVAGGAVAAVEPQAHQAALAPYVRSLLQEQIAPAVAECYEHLLSGSPTASGAVFLELAVMGDQAFGAVVANTAFGAGTVLTDPSFHACVIESLKALVLKPPPEGHKAFTIEQSFELEP